MITFFIRTRSDSDYPEAFSEAEAERATSDATVRFFNSLGFMRRYRATDHMTGYRYVSRVVMRDPAGKRVTELWKPHHIPTEKLGAREWRVLGMRDVHASLEAGGLVVFSIADPEEEGRAITCTWSEARGEFVA